MMAKDTVSTNLRYDLARDSQPAHECDHPSLVDASKVAKRRGMVQIYPRPSCRMASVGRCRFTFQCLSRERHGLLP